MSQNARLAVVVAIGAVIGSVVNHLMRMWDLPRWLTNDMTMGLQPPLSLDLLACQISFGFTLTISFATVIGMFIALVAFYRLK